MKTIEIIDFVLPQSHIQFDQAGSAIPSSDKRLYR